MTNLMMMVKKFSGNLRTSEEPVGVPVDVRSQNTGHHPLSVVAPRQVTGSRGANLAGAWSRRDIIQVPQP